MKFSAKNGNIQINWSDKQKYMGSDSVTPDDKELQNMTSAWGTS